MRLSWITCAIVLGWLLAKPQSAWGLPFQESAPGSVRQGPDSCGVPAADLDRSRLARARKQTVLVVDLTPTGPDSAMAARSFSLELYKVIGPRCRLLSLLDVPAVEDVSAVQYWKNCPEPIACLQLLAERVAADIAIMGTVYRREIPHPAGPSAGDVSMAVVHLRLIDIVQGEELPSLTVETPLGDPSPITEAVLLALASPDATAPLRLYRDGPPETAGPRNPAPDASAVAGITLAGAATEPEAWSALDGHRGQFFIRVAGGALVGPVRQEYIDYSLVGEGESTSEQYVRLSSGEGFGGVGTLGIGYGVSRYVDLEVRISRIAANRTIREYREYASLYSLDPFDEAACTSGEASGGNCPSTRAQAAGGWSGSVSSRVALLSPRPLRPFLVGGLGAFQAVSTPSTNSSSGEEGDSPLIFEPLRTGGVFFGPGLMYDSSRRLSLFVHLPLQFTLWSSPVSSQEYHYQNGDGPYFQELPSSPEAPRPFSAQLELGVQIRLF